MIASLLFVASLLLATANGAGVEFSYNDQAAWPDVCVTGNNGRQSPINIEKGNVRENSDLIPLEFNAGWTTSISGTFSNTGHNVQFDPSPGSAAVTTRTHLGTYQVAQMHMHWGRNNNEGSEHTVDGKSYSLELHFVHTKQGETNSSAGDYYGVVGVFAEAAADMEISGVWSQLNASAVQSYPTSIDVTDFMYASLLPTSRDYHYYMGSLTTPTCDETVQWFVMKETIRVPSAYLTYLRQVESANENETLTFNFRDVQTLDQRTVYEIGNGAPKIVASTLFMLLTSIITMHFL